MQHAVTMDPPARATTPVVEPYRPPYVAAALATLGVFLLYTLTLAPTTAFWDTSEYIATGHMLGIPHPPGNPLFVLLARTWDLLLAPFGLSTAVRINLFSATMGALAHGCWFLLAHRVLSFVPSSRTFRLVGAAAAVLVSATAFTVWNQSNVNEKVYTVSLFTIALLSFLAFRWRDHIGEGKDDNLILLMLFILALSVGNHLMAFLAAPAIVIFILLVAPRTLANWRLYVFGVLAIMLGISVHLFLPIRAGLDPVINEADPSCPTFSSSLVSVLTLGAAGCENLSAALKRQQYQKPSMFKNPVLAAQGQDAPRDAGLLGAQIGNYFQYFDWQWARSVAGHTSWFGGLRPLFTLLFMVLGAYGALRHYRADRISWWYVFVLFGTLSFGLMFYLNFRYGYTYPMGGSFTEMREVRERDYFFIVGFSVWGLWAGIGVAALWLNLTERLAERATRWRADLAAAPVLGLALIPLAFNWSWASRADDYIARDWSYNVLMSVEPYGLLFTNGDNDTFPLWYLQEVEGIRRDVTVMVMSYLNTPWYVEQIKGLTEPCAPGEDPLADPTTITCQRPFQAENEAELYADFIQPDASAAIQQQGPPGTFAPQKSIMPLSVEQIHQVVNTRPYLLEESLLFRAGNIETVLPQGEPMMPSDIFLAAMVTAAIDDRPIHFAMTTQAYEELGLRPYLIRQGLTYKLNNGVVQPDPARGIYRVPDSSVAPLVGPYIDVPRTERLLSEVFMHRGGFPLDWNRWVDSATNGIPLYYGYTHLGLGTVYDAAGDSAAANRHYQRGQDFLRVGSLGQEGGN